MKEGVMKREEVGKERGRKRNESQEGRRKHDKIA